MYRKRKLLMLNISCHFILVTFGKFGYAHKLFSQIVFSQNKSVHWPFCSLIHPFGVFQKSDFKEKKKMSMQRGRELSSNFKDWYPWSQSNKTFFRKTAKFWRKIIFWHKFHCFTTVWLCSKHFKMWHFWIKT